MDIVDMMDNLKKEDGMWSDSDITALERISGKNRDELFSIYETGKKPNFPEGHPNTWQRSEKLSFIDAHGRSEYERLIRERK